ncbi:MAG: hypothetical protein EXS50_01960 [Candidatus Taylorbacteria bacterium]|nr:hypothetical protein [Candidatus Taylorbacteria bacterium]
MPETTIAQILAHAENMKGDSKVWVNPAQLREVLAQRETTLIDERHDGSNFVVEVQYHGYRFQHVSRTKWWEGLLPSNPAIPSRPPRGIGISLECGISQSQC